MNIDYDSLFCFVDDFYKGFEPWYKKSLLTCGTKKRNREGKMSLSEIITILIAFHQSGMACFKYFYLELIRNYRNLFNYLTPTVVKDSILATGLMKVYHHGFDS